MQPAIQSSVKDTVSFDASNQGTKDVSQRSSRASHRPMVAWGFGLGLCVAVTASACSSDKSNPKDSANGGGGQAGETASGTAGQTAEQGGGGANANGGGSSAGGSSAAGGGSAGTTIAYLPGPAACVTSATWTGKIAKPNPLVSLGKTATDVTFSTGVTGADLAFDGLYHGQGVLLTPVDATTPSWVAIHVGTAFTKLLLTWIDTGYGAEFNVPVAAPKAYVIESSATGADGTWTTVVGGEETNNVIRGRSHAFEFTGMQWVRFKVTDAPKNATTGAYLPVRIDEIAIYDISNGTEGSRDTWLQMGDSITRMSFDRGLNATAKDFDQLNHAARSSYTPAMVGAGIGSESTAQGLAHAKTWLSKFEGLDFVTFAYGTNDSWGNNSPVSKAYEANLRSFIEVVKAAGKTPVLVRIPFSGVATQVLPAYNEIVQKLTTEFDLPCGPDLYTWFASNQTDLKSDTVHPTAAGEASINRLYSEVLLPLYPTP